MSSFSKNAALWRCVDDDRLALLSISFPLCRYTQAKANVGLLTVTTPYDDALGAGKIVTIATTVDMDGALFGVMGMDVSANLLLEMMTQHVAKCQTHQYVKFDP